MHRRLLTPILALLVLLTGVPVAAQTPAATGGGAWRIAETRELDLGTRAPTLSPDGRWLAGQGPEGSFCVWDAETGVPTCAGENLPIRAETVAWSPDGTAVAFALDAIRMAYESDIYVYEVATGKLTNVTDDGAEGGLMDNLDIDPPGDDVPVWSPDSQELAFVRSLRGDDEPGTTTIMRIGRAGGEPTEVLRIGVEGPFAVWMPMFWLPDGTLVYAQSSVELSDPRNGIWTVDVDGGEPVQVAPGATESEIPGAMIVDVDAGRGQAVVVAWMLANQRGAGGDQPLYWLVDLDTGEREPFPALPAEGDRAPTPVSAGYSPDGETILLAALGDEGFVLLALDPESLAVTPVKGEPIEAAPMPGTALVWASNDTVALHAPQGAVVVTLVTAGDAQAASPEASPAASPVASGSGWRIVDEHELSVESRYVAMSPDGTQLAGVDGDGRLCVWVTETLVSTCVEERLPIRAETIAWAPDGTAVAFALDAIRMLYDSDIYVYEIVTGELVNLTDDGVEGDVIDALDTDAPIDDVPTWSPDGERIAFARSYWGGDDEPGSTSIMVIDRAGGEPVDLLPLDVEEPLAIWMPMHWLPDGTLLYSQMARDVEDPRNGVWKIGVDDGANPLQIVPGGEESEVPGPWISDATGDHAIVYSYWLMGQFAFDADQPLFWLADVATGERDALAAPGGDAWILDAGFSPDGETALLVTRSPEGARLVVLDVASGEIAPLDPAPRDMAFAPGSPQWAANDTVLLQTPSGPVLLTLESAG